jgi:hypothetical protein
VQKIKFVGLVVFEKKRFEAIVDGTRTRMRGHGIRTDEEILLS